MTYEEIARLGQMVEINITESEAKDLIPKMESVLGYIDQIKNVEVKDVDVLALNGNDALRSDEIENEANFTEDFLMNVPKKEEGYVKVEKILGGE